MDEVDRAIIRELRRNARISNVELAARVKLSPSPCLRRIRALEQAGTIRGYHADVDPAPLGQGFEVTVLVELYPKDRATIEAFEAQVARFEEVVECRRMYGDPDYIVRVAVADTNEYERFLTTKLAELPGVGRTNSQLTMKIVKPSSL